MTLWRLAMHKKYLAFISLVLLAGCVLPIEPAPTEMPPATMTPAIGLTPESTLAYPRIDFRPVPLQVGYGVMSPWLDIYFTEPFSPDADTRRGGPNKPLADAIYDAHLSVEVAAYSLNLWNIRDALIDAYHRGVDVRLVMESENMDGEEVQELLAAGIPIVGDAQDGLMHDKFVIIDRQEVWLGSMNFTVGGGYEDNNNLVRIRSVEVAQDYLTEFNEMFDDNAFGPIVVPQTPYPLLTIDGTPVEIYFSPDDGVAARIVDLLSRAQESIYFMAFSFTNDAFGETVILQAENGLDVKGVMDYEQVMSNTGTEYDRFAQAGIGVLLDGNFDGLMHHKVFIIDESIVITGSYNFSRNAEENNDENIVIFFSPDIAAQFIKEFERVYAVAQKVTTP
jgi:phosphatidylserine/phosphatidylglycerophosphate/cardiolipin synthase-like enzyme